MPVSSKRVCANLLLVIVEVQVFVRPQKIHYLNASLDEALYNELAAFCEKMGMSKTGACEQAIRMYMDVMTGTMDNVKKKAEINAHRDVAKYL